jgi:hypothetical protein
MEIIEANKLFQKLGFIKRTSSNCKEFRGWFAGNVGAESNFFGTSIHSKNFMEKRIIIWRRSFLGYISVTKWITKLIKREGAIVTLLIYVLT